MKNTDRFRRVEGWRSAVGLLSVPLRGGVEESNRFVLLNGLTGNFCLDFGPPVDPLTQRIAAWSADVGHYVAVDDETVSIHRWDQTGIGETYSWRSVVEHIHDFHRYLERNQPDRTKGVINHVLRVFRVIRETLRERDEAPHSLQLLLHMLACGASGIERSRLVPDEWGLSAAAIDYADNLPSATWESLYSDLIGSGRYDVLSPDLDLVLRHAAGALFQETHIEVGLSANMWLPGLAMPARLRASSRPETGVYFTPPAIARSLAEEALRQMPKSKTDGITIFDPACGSGELLHECLRQLKLMNYRGHVKIVGFDKSASSVTMARFALAAEKRYWPPKQVDVEFVEQDSLEAVWPCDIDILIMNPPFLSWQEMDTGTQNAVAGVLGSQLRYRPNLAMAFAVKATTAVGDDSVLAMIAPSSLFEGESAKRVREALASRFRPVLIARFGNQRAFAHTFVDAGMYVGSTGEQNPQDPAVLWADSQAGSLSRALRGLRRWRGAEIEPLKEEGFAVYSRKGVGGSGAPWIARSFDAWKRYEAARRSRQSVNAETLFDIRQGARLGNDVFILTTDQTNSLPKAEQKFFRPAVMNFSINEGRLADSYYIFYPYSPGLPSLETEQDLVDHLAGYYSLMLEPAKARLQKRKSITTENRNWWDLERPRSWQFESKPKIVSKYFGDKKSFALDESGKYVVVVGHAWIVRDGQLEVDVSLDELQLAAVSLAP